ncbi:MAG: hypothetical protein KF729_15240 [Sandaracinaceae bacterium]|nr:hypothetical protein [Sandaracinaceae bacterium]
MRCTLLAAVALPILWSGAARATTFADVTVDELVAASDLVVVGRVLTTDVLPEGPAGQPGIHTRARVRVDETLRGPGYTVVDVWVQGGRLGDRLRVVPGQATFRAGEDVVLFLFRAGGGLWPTGMGRGKWTPEPGSPGAIHPRDALRASGPALAPVTLDAVRRAARQTSSGEVRP